MQTPKLNLEIIPLAIAYICLDCDSIGGIAGHCIACGSRSVAGLAGIIGHLIPVIPPVVESEPDVVNPFYRPLAKVRWSLRLNRRRRAGDVRRVIPEQSVGKILEMCLRSEGRNGVTAMGPLEGPDLEGN